MLELVEQRELLLELVEGLRQCQLLERLPACQALALYQVLRPSAAQQ